jgi:hypothetical protein
MRPVPYPKKIETYERLFFHFKIDPTNYVLFDSTMSTPAIFGSYNLVAATITNLPKDATIFYYELDNFLGWKMKKAYRPDKKLTSTAKREQVIKGAKSDLT